MNVIDMKGQFSIAGDWDDAPVGRMLEAEAQRVPVATITVDADTLARLLHLASTAHHSYEVATGKADADWQTWYAKWMVGGGNSATGATHA